MIAENAPTADLVAWVMSRDDARDLLRWLRHNRPLVISEDGEMRDEVRTDDGSGDELDLPTAVGMLAIAQHTMLCEES